MHARLPSHPRRDAGFSLFYSGINIGAMLGGILCVSLGKNYGWNWCFLSTGLVMILGLLVFTGTSRQLEPLGHSPLIPEGTQPTPDARFKLIATYVGSLAVIPFIYLLLGNPAYTNYFMWTVGPVVLAWFLWSMRACTAEEAKKLVVALVLVLFSIMFWGIFEQSGGSLAIVAENNLATSETDTLPISINNSSNSVFVILFAPLLGILWLKMKDKEPDSVVKFALGFLFLAGGYWVFQSLIKFADPTGHSSLAIFTAAYFMVTVGELCLSPIGLSAMTKLAPRRMYGVMMGMWFLASAYGQYVAGQLGASMASPNPNATKLEKLQSYTDGYGQLAIYAVICAVLMLALSPMLKKLAKGSA